MSALTALLQKSAGPLQLVALLLTPVLLLQGFTARLDYHPADETVYWLNGVALFSGEANAWVPAWSPMYSLFLGVLAAVLPESIHAMDASFVLVPTCTGLAIWWALRAWTHSWVAWAVATWFVTSSVATDTESLRSHPEAIRMMVTMVNLFGACLMFVAVGCVARRRYVAFLLTIAAMVFVRGETAGVSLLCGLLLLWRSRSDRSLRWLAVVMILLSLIANAYVLTSQSFRQRSLFNYQQNWSRVDWLRRGKPAFEQGDAPFSIQRFRIAYPEAQSLFGALKENPAATLAHVRFNLSELPHSLADAVLLGGMACLPGLRWVFVAGLAGLALLALVLTLSRGAPPLRAGPPQMWLYLAATLGVVPPLLLMYTPGRFILPLVPLGLSLLAVAVHYLTSVVDEPRLNRILATVAPAAFLVALLCYPSLDSGSGNSTPPRRAFVHWLQTELPDEDWRMLAHYGSNLSRLAGKDRLIARDLEPLVMDQSTDPERLLSRLREFDAELLALTREAHAVMQGAEGFELWLSEGQWTVLQPTASFVVFARTGGSESLDAWIGAQKAKQEYAPRIRVSKREEVGPEGKTGSRAWSIDAGKDFAGASFQVVGTSSGTLPGIFEPGFWLPLNPDSYMDFFLSNPDELIQPTLGTLDENGRAELRWNPSPELREESADWSKLRHLVVCRDAKTGVIFARSEPF